MMTNEAPGAAVIARERAADPTAAQCEASDREDAPQPQHLARPSFEVIDRNALRPACR